MSGRLNISHIIHLIKEVLNKGEKVIPLHEPQFCGNEWLYVKDCLETGWVSSVGSYVERFEKMLVDYTGVNYAVAVVNGTAALHLCLKVAGIKSEDEVLTPALTFVATANSVIYCGAIPHFIDCGTNFGINTEKLDEYLKDIVVFKNGICINKYTNRHIRAVIVMHTFGHPDNLDAVLDICKKYRLLLIEDGAEALGSLYKNKHIGNWGKLSALSFNGNKIITTGGGGAILTNDKKLAELTRHLSTTAKVPHPWAFYHDQIGYNYRLPNINAAIGCAQLEMIDKFIYSKRILAEKYEKIFRGVEGVTFFKEPKYARSNYWLNAILLDEKYKDFRDEFLNESHREGILCRPIWTLMSELPMFKNCPKMDLSMSSILERSVINIPSSAGLGVVNNET